MVSRLFCNLCVVFLCMCVSVSVYVCLCLYAYLCVQMEKVGEDWLTCALGCNLTVFWQVTRLKVDLKKLGEQERALLGHLGATLGPPEESWGPPWGHLGPSCLLLSLILAIFNQVILTLAHLSSS